MGPGLRDVALPLPLDTPQQLLDVTVFDREQQLALPGVEAVRAQETALGEQRELLSRQQAAMDEARALVQAELGA